MTENGSADSGSAPTSDSTTLPPTGASPPPTASPTGEASGTSTERPKKETKAERKARLAEASRVMREAKAAKRASTTAPTPAAAATSSPTTPAPGGAGSAAPSAATPASGEPPKEKPLDAWAKVAEAQRKHELAQQALKRAQDEHAAQGKAREADLARAEKFKPLDDLIAGEKDAEIMQLVYGDGWRDAWLRMTSAMAPIPPKPLTEADVRKAAAEEHARLAKEASEKEASDKRTRTEEGLTKYIARVRELATLAAGKYPSSQARGSFDNRDRFREILTEEYTKTGTLPDPQAVLDRIEAEDTAFFRQALPYAAQPVTQALPASGPAKTLTPALKQGGGPPDVTSRPLSPAESAAAAKARLKARSEAQRLTRQ